MTGTGVRTPRRSVDAIAFDLVLLAFTGLIVYTALGIGHRAGLVPLVIGIPTLLGLLVQLAQDVLPRRAGARATQVTAEVSAEPGAVHPPASRLATAGVEDLLAAAAEEEAADDELPSSPEARRSQALLAIWAVAFVALAATTNFRVAAPVALFAILYLTTRRVVPTVAITLVTSALLYVIFDVFLDVAF